MYDAVVDPYCYPGTTVLKNRAGITNARALARFEAEATARRAEEPLPEGALGAAQYRAIHRHLFQDVYPWAGQYRTVRIGKGGSAFCYPEHIRAEMQTLFSKLRRKRHLRGVSADDFALAGAEFLAELNAIHPFREGNGRTQLAFFALLAERAQHPLAFNKLRPRSFLAAMVTSFHGDTTPLVRAIRKMAR